MPLENTKNRRDLTSLLPRQMQSEMFSKLTACLSGLAVGFIGVAGIVKLSDISSFHATLGGWSLFPTWMTAPLAVLVPGIEICIAGLWLAMANRRPAEFIALGFILSVTTAAVLQTVFFGYVDCGCFGRRSQAEASRDDFVFLIIRNSFLVMAISLSLLAQRGRSS